MAKKKTKKLNSKQSRYSKKKLEEDYSKDDELDEEYDEPIEEEFDETDEGLEDYNEEPIQPIAPVHPRSRGLFNNIWWKKGILKGVAIWIAFVILFYLFDALGMVEVISWKRWAFFLVLLAILGMTYQKYLSGRVEI